MRPLGAPTHRRGVGEGFKTLAEKPNFWTADAVRKGVGHVLGATYKARGANYGRYLGFPDKLSSTLEARHGPNF
jgi:hypothetical protein